MRPSEACELFISRKLIFDEPVEVIISDLKRLAGLIGIKSVDMNTVEPFIRGQLLKALPSEQAAVLGSCYKVTFFLNCAI